MSGTAADRAARTARLIEGSLDPVHNSKDAALCALTVGHVGHGPQRPRRLRRRDAARPGRRAPRATGGVRVIRAALLGFAVGAAITVAACIGVALLDIDLPRETS